MKEIGGAISDEMGAPLGFAEKFQAGAGLGHIMTTLDVLKSYPFEEPLGSAMLVREPVGVVGMITPWNWPLNQIACKVAPRSLPAAPWCSSPPSTRRPRALIFAEILHDASRLWTSNPDGVMWTIGGRWSRVAAHCGRHETRHAMYRPPPRSSSARGGGRSHESPAVTRNVPPPPAAPRDRATSPASRSASA